MPAVDKTVVNGVPAYLAAVEGPTHVGLVFRVGVADEPLPVRGVTHLCEHLVLAEMHGRDHFLNGFVGWNRTEFVASGSDDQIVAYVHDVVAGLGNLPVGRFDKERSILRAESATRGNGTLEMLLHRRFGAQSYGRAAFPEYGLWSLDVDEARRWAAERFAGANTALWIAGPDPAALADRLHLEFADALDVDTRGDHHVGSLPGRQTANVAGPNMSMIVPRSIATTAAIGLLRSRLENEIRHRRGLAYTAASTYEPLDAEIAHAHLGIDAVPEGRVEATTAMYELVEQFADVGPAADEVEKWREAIATSWVDPATNVGRTAEAARERALTGVDPAALDFDALDAESVRAALASGLTTALFLVPDGVRPNRRFPQMPAIPPRPLDGTRYQVVKHFDQTELLVVGDDGLAWSRGTIGEHITITPPEFEAVLCWEDGQRTIVGSDGRDVWVAPWNWRKGDELVAAIDRATPPSVRVPMGAGSGPPPRTSSWWKRRGH